MLSKAKVQRLNAAYEIIARLQREAGIPSWFSGAVALAGVEKSLLKLEGAKIPRDRRALTALDFALQLNGRTCVGVMCGTNYDARKDTGEWNEGGEFYYNLNSHLAPRLAKIPNPDPELEDGAVCLSGGSFGIGMWGLIHCYKKVLKETGSGGFVASVYSALEDERINPDVDPTHSAEMQRSILAREFLLILGACDATIVYPGSDGTFSEVSLARLMNYCRDRGLRAGNKLLAIEPPRRPIIIVDWPLGNGEWFYEAIAKKQREHVGRLMAPKAKANVSVEYIKTTDPAAAADKVISYILHNLVSTGRVSHARAFPHEL